MGYGGAANACLTPLFPVPTSVLSRSFHSPSRRTNTATCGASNSARVLNKKLGLVHQSIII